MAYEWKLKPHPYSLEEAFEIIDRIISQQFGDWKYDTGQAGHIGSFDMTEIDPDNADREVPATEGKTSEEQKADKANDKESGNRRTESKKQSS